MIIYRPSRRNTFELSMSEAKEFKSFSDMETYIKNQFGEYSEDNITIEGQPFDDERNGWKGVKEVCLKRCRGEDYIEMYGSPQTVGFCSVDY